MTNTAFLLTLPYKKNAIQGNGKNTLLQVKVFQHTIRRRID
jgi:hypothetical protein